MKRYLIIIFTSILALSCSKESGPYLDIPSINEGFEFGYEGGKSLGTIISNSDFEINSDSPWCVVTCYKENKVSNFRVDVQENLYAVKRVATLTVTVEGCEDRTIKVRQAAADPILKVNIPTFNLDQNAADIEVEVTSNVNVKVTLPDWISLGDGVEITMGRNIYTFHVDQMDGMFREGEIVLQSTDYADKKAVIKVVQMAADLVVFEDDFSWAIGPELCNSTSGEIRWDKCTDVVRPDWTTTVFTGAGTEDAPTPAAWTRNGYIRMNYGKKSSNLVTPKLSVIKGTANLEVTFRACRYQTSNGPDAYHEIHVACIGAGTVSKETFNVENCNNLDSKATSWYLLDDSIYTFTITGATADTQIEFHFGPRREASDYNTNLDGATRMGFDDVKVVIDID